MTIYRTAQATNYTILSNDIANANLSGNATAALLYLISKPKNWNFNANDLKRRLKVGLNKVYRIMRELITAGYAEYQRIQSGTIWHIYDVPKNNIQPICPTSPVECHRVKNEHVKNEHVYKEIKKHKVIEQQPQTPQNEQKSVVVDIVEINECLIYPKDLTIKQKKACKSIIKRAPEEHQQPILFALAYQLTVQKINSVPAYLTKLVKASLNDEFTAIDAADASIPINLRINRTTNLLNEYRAIKTTKPSSNMIASLRSAITRTTF